MTYEPFNGDGRVRLLSQWHLPGTCPLPVTHAQARHAIDRFRNTGHSTHSANGGTLWVLLEWCQRHKVPYTLTARPGMGYVVTKD